MQTFMVLTENSEQIQALEAFLKALKIKYKTAATLEDLESRLSKKQMEIWEGVKSGLEWTEKYKKGEIPLNEVKTLNELLNEHAYENHIISAV